MPLVYVGLGALGTLFASRSAAGITNSVVVLGVAAAAVYIMVKK